MEVAVGDRPPRTSITRRKTPHIFWRRHAYRPQSTGAVLHCGSPWGAILHWDPLEGRSFIRSPWGKILHRGHFELRTFFGGPLESYPPLEGVTLRAILHWVLLSGNPSCDPLAGDPSLGFPCRAILHWGHLEWLSSIGGPLRGDPQLGPNERRSFIEGFPWEAILHCDSLKLILHWCLLA